MRTTIDISDELMSILQERTIAEKSTLKDEINLCLAKGLGVHDPQRAEIRLKTYQLGAQSADYAKAWAMVEELERVAVADKLELKK
jgi:hypothetical protein